jgi:signal transduction histidine kinase
MLGVTVRSWWIVVLSAVGLANFAALAAGSSWEPADPLWDVPAVVGQLATAGVLMLGPWVYVTATRVDGEAPVRRLLRRVTAAVAVLTTVGVGFAVGADLGVSTAEDPAAVVEMVGQIGSVTVAVAFLLALGGLVLGPWVVVLTRQVTRERAGRLLAEERAEVAAHLHDSVLQTLTLIQMQPDQPATVTRLARHTERELRAWLAGDQTTGDDDLAGALRAAAAGIEDRFATQVELVTVGTRPLDARGRAVAGAAREALTNAAKHAGVAKISVFAEITETEVLVVVRDRGRGFAYPAPVAPDRRGIAESILGRMRTQGGTAEIRSSHGQGTEVELRMPVGRTA